MPATQIRETFFSLSPTTYKIRIRSKIASTLGDGDPRLLTAAGDRVQIRWQNECDEMPEAIENRLVDILERTKKISFSIRSMLFIARYRFISSQSVLPALPDIRERTHEDPLTSNIVLASSTVARKTTLKHEILKLRATCGNYYFS